MPDTNTPGALTPEHETTLNRIFGRDTASPLRGEPQSTSPLKLRCDELRAALKVAELAARAIKDDPTFKGEQVYAGQHGEMIAQSMLAVRHIEDARMRIGKVLQYSGDGVSIYDKA